MVAGYRISGRMLPDIRPDICDFYRTLKIFFFQGTYSNNDKKRRLCFFYSCAVFFQIEYEGTKQKLMEMVNFIFMSKIIKYPAEWPDTGYLVLEKPEIRQKSISGRVISSHRKSDRTLVPTLCSSLALPSALLS